MNQSMDNQIVAFYQKWFYCMENADVSGFLSLLNDDFYFKGPGQPAVTDKMLLKSGLEQYHRSFFSSVDWKIENIELLNEQALVRIHESVKLTNRENGEMITLSGVHLALLIRKHDNWYCKLDISSLDHPA